MYKRIDMVWVMIIVMSFIIVGLVVLSAVIKPPRLSLTDPISQRIYACSQLYDEVECLKLIKYDTTQLCDHLLAY